MFNKNNSANTASSSSSSSTATSTATNKLLKTTENSPAALERLAMSYQEENPDYALTIAWQAHEKYVKIAGNIKLPISERAHAAYKMYRLREKYDYFLQRELPTDAESTEEGRETRKKRALTILKFAADNGHTEAIATFKAMQSQSSDETRNISTHKSSNVM